jgi:hypothetical protein
MESVALIVSCLSLVAVVVIGWRTILVGARAAKASEDSASASERSAKASEESAAASSLAAAATERSVAASERAAALAEQDAIYRRLEALLDVVLAMRELFNEQHASQVLGSPWVPAYNSPEALARLALMRKLEGRLVPFDERFDSNSACRILTTSYLWSSTHLEQAIEALKQLLRSTTRRP